MTLVSKKLPELVEVMSVSAVVEVLKTLAETAPSSDSPEAAFAAPVDVVEVDSRLAVSGALKLSSKLPEGAVFDFDGGLCDDFKSSS